MKNVVYWRLTSECATTYTKKTSPDGSVSHWLQSRGAIGQPQVHGAIEHENTCFKTGASFETFKPQHNYDGVAIFGDELCVRSNIVPNSYTTNCVHWRRHNSQMHWHKISSWNSLFHQARSCGLRRICIARRRTDNSHWRKKTYTRIRRYTWVQFCTHT